MSREHVEGTGEDMEWLSQFSQIHNMAGKLERRYSSASPASWECGVSDPCRDAQNRATEKAREAHVTLEVSWSTRGFRLHYARQKMCTWLQQQPWKLALIGVCRMGHSAELRISGGV